MLKLEGSGDMLPQENFEIYDIFLEFMTSETASYDTISFKFQR